MKATLSAINSVPVKGIIIIVISIIGVLLIMLQQVVAT